MISRLSAAAVDGQRAIDAELDAQRRAFAAFDDRRESEEEEEDYWLDLIRGAEEDTLVALAAIEEDARLRLAEVRLVTRVLS